MQDFKDYKSRILNECIGNTVAYPPYLFPVQDFKDYKPRILLEYIGKYTEAYKIAYGIVAYSFVIRYSLFVIRVSNSLNFP